MNRRKIAYCVVALVGAVNAWATDGTWVWGASGQPAATSPQTAADWATAGNWKDSTVAAGVDATATVPKNDYPFITVGEAVTIGSIFHTNPSMSNVARFIGDGSLNFSCATAQAPIVCGARLSVPSVFTCSESKREIWFGGVEIGAPMTCPDDAVIIAYYSDLGWRRDLFADGASETITNPFPTNEVEFWGSFNLRYVAPQGAPAVVSSWAQTAGSAYLTCAQTAKPAVAVGTTVTGTGIPDGTYVKRILDEGTIELSAAATTTSDANDLTFAAFTPNMVQEVKELSFANRSFATTGTLFADKYRTEDGLRVVVNKLDETRHFTFCVDTTAGFVPGTIVLHDTVSFDMPLVLGTSHLEFDGAKAGWTKSSVFMKTADDVAHVTIPEGVAATFKALTNVVGTLVKDGAGSLTAEIVNAEDFGETGTLAVEGGALTLTSATETAPINVKGLVLSAGATLTIPTCGLRCTETFSAGAGAQIGGTGTLILPYDADVSGVTVGADVKLVRLADSRIAIKSSDYLTEIPAAATKADILALAPALWVDVTDDSTVTLADSWLSELRDVRGRDYGYSTNDGTGPQIVSNESGAVSHLYIKRVGTVDATKRQTINWNRTISGIRAVFKVVYAVNGGGQLLGRSNYWRDTVAEDADVPLFGNAPESYTNNATFVVNGEARDWRLGYPYKGGGESKPVDKWVPTVVEFYPPDATMTMKGFGFGASYTRDKTGKGVNGNERFGECLVFTSELTTAQKVAIRRYLMEKWFKNTVETGHESDFGRSVEHDVATKPNLEISAGSALCVSNLVGAGTLTKSGAGALYLGDVHANDQSLVVAGGTVSIRSVTPTAPTLLADAALHFDVETEGTLTNPGTATTAWADVRGAGYPTATIANYKSGSKTVTVTNDTTLGHKFVDFGARETNRSSINQGYLELEEEIPVRTGFTVLNVTADRPGGQLFGGDTQTLYITNNNYYGLYNSGTPTPLVNSDYYKNREVFSAAPQAGRACWRMNQTGIVALTYRLENGCNLFSCGLYEPIHAKTFSVAHYSTNKWCSGGNLLGEVIYYTNKLSKAHLRDVEAYLAKKWQNVDVTGYRPAQLATLTVAAGSTVEVTGNAPLTVGTLNCAGTIHGAVKMAAGSTIEAVVASDGSVSCGSFEQATVDVSSGGTLRVTSASGRRPAQGAHALFPVTGTLGTWTIVGEGFGGKDLALRVENNVLYLDANSGFMIITR